ncbi:DNA cytosine methyltransferase [Streptomyces mirabilis]|uniref:DNA cytosine methyltransferase n=1 Tax=Streptomyces mirabilis TaxID=68239 RepID=UPI002E2BC6F2|nr:DNA cytosine methyltransferase [Streptomyces mirabilis]
MTLLAADFFAGGGGSSSGMTKVPGVDLRLAANHWSLAVETHQLHFPNAMHECADLSQVDFRRYPRVDILWASPECTNHSIAQGRKKAQEDQIPDFEGNVLPLEAGARSRATAWDVPRYLEEMIRRGKPVLGGVVENVVDFAKWVLYPAWKKTLESLGYVLHVAFLNSAHAHSRKSLWAPQSRDRMYVGFIHESVGRKVDWEKWLRPFATCVRHGLVRARQVFKKKGEPWGRFRAQYTYKCPEAGCTETTEPRALPASEAIDWSLENQRIGDRKKPLATKTLKRIEDGLQRYAQPLLVPVEGRDGKEARPVDEPGRTQTTRRETGVLIPSSFIAELRGGNSKHRSLKDPLATVCASGNHHGLLVPYFGTGRTRTTGEPVGTLTTVDRYALLEAQVEVEDCLFRMLQPAEIGRAMSFEPDHHVLGSKREQVRMLGNAVTPNAAEVLVSALTEAITGEDLEPACAA